MPFVPESKAENVEAILNVYNVFSPAETPGGGGYFRNFWVGMCRWDPGTLNLYQS